jgi:hypothetical protein
MKTIFLLFLYTITVFTFMSCADDELLKLAESNAVKNKNQPEESNTFINGLKSIESNFENLFKDVDIKKYFSGGKKNNELNTLKNKAGTLFDTHKNDLSNKVVEGLNKSKQKSISLFEAKKENDIQFANSFMTNIINLVKNNETILSEGDIADINQTGASFFNLLFSIAESEKNFTNTGTIEHKREIIEALMQQSKSMKKVILKAKNKFEQQGNTTLNSEDLFSFSY